MSVVWLTPTAALVGVAALVPVAAWLLGERRVRRARSVLRLEPPLAGTWWAPAAIVATLALVAVAAAQPVLATAGGRPHVRSGQVFVVVDTSESMRAGRPTRYDRAVAAAERLADDLPRTPLGLASMTDRVLPHVFPTIDHDDYRATLRESMGIDRPPPGRVRVQASGFDALAVLGRSRFFTNDTGARVVVLLTDGESRSFAPQSVASALRDARVRVVIVRFWRGGERIAGDAVYHSDPSSGAAVASLARALRAPVFEESQLGDAVRAVDRALGAEERPLPPQAASTARPLAPFAMLAALLPLGFLLWRRNVR